MTAPLTFEQFEQARDRVRACEWYQADDDGIVPVECPHPAAWLLLTVCKACGDPTTQAVCDPHYRYVTAGSAWTYCTGCGRHNAGFHRSVERL